MILITCGCASQIDKYLDLKYPGCERGEKDALKAILHHESNSIRLLKKYHFIWASFHETDPLAQCISDMWKLRLNVNLFHFETNQKFNINKDKTRKNPIYVDFSLI